MIIKALLLIHFIGQCLGQFRGSIPVNSAFDFNSAVHASSEEENLNEEPLGQNRFIPRVNFDYEDYLREGKSYFQQTTGYGYPKVFGRSTSRSQHES